MTQEGRQTMRYSPLLISTAVIGAAVLAATAALALEPQDAKGAAMTSSPRAGLTELARIDAKEPDARSRRDAKEQAKNELNQIIAYYNAAIKKDPKDDDAYFHRGIAKFFAGAAMPARADIAQASKLDPKYPYYALWIDIIDKRGNAPSTLEQGITRVDMTKWPAPVIRMFLGETTPAAVLAAADDPDPKTKVGQVCEADFYSGELALQQGAKEEAARLFNLAANSCPREFVEGPAARDELAALDGIE
jgi:lipoprotein NlpI